MAIYKVRDPSGRIREIKGPDGASDEEILAQAQTLFGNEQPAAKLEPKSDDELRRDAVQQAFDESTGLQKFGIGVAKPFVEGYHGIRKAVGGKPDESAEARLQAVRGGAATAGELAGNVGMMLAPAGAVARGLTAAPKAALAADAALNTVASGLQSMGRGEGFKEGAAAGAIGSGIGGVIGKGVNAARGGIRNLMELRPGAREAIERGIPLTPGQAADGGVQRLENAMANVPVIGTPIRNLQRESVSGWNRTILQDVAPNPKDVTAGGHEGFQQVTKQFGDAYDDLFKGTVKTNTDDLMVLDSMIDDLDQLSSLERGAAKEALERLHGTLGKGEVSGATLQQLDDDLRNAATAAVRKGNHLEAEALREGRDFLRSSVPKELNERWGELDSKFRQFATTRRAATYQGSAKNAGVFTPAELLRAAGAQDKSAGKRAFAQGKAPLQQEALAAEDMFQLPSRGLAEQLSAPIGVGAALVNPVAAGAAYAGSRLTINEPVRKAIINKMLKNKPLTPQELEAAVRMGITFGGAAGATAE